MNESVLLGLGSTNKILISQGGVMGERVGFQKLIGRRTEGWSLLQNRRSGVTLLELLVAITIIGILFSLTASAVQSARESARRMQCQSHLKQMMLACHNYNSTHEMFPPGNVYGYSLHAAILPYIDRANLYHQIDYDTASATQAGPGSDPLRNFHIPLYLCPSDPVGKGGNTNYYGNAGIGVQCDGYHGPFVPLQNPGFRNQGPVSAAAISDGLSQTVGLSEGLVGGGIRSELRTIWDTPDQAFGRCDQHDEFLHACSNVNLNNLIGDEWTRGASWLSGDTSSTLYTHISTPNRRSCYNNSWVPGAAITATSLHPGGVNVQLMDGSGRFVSDSIDQTIWRALGTRDGSEPVSTSW